MLQSDSSSGERVKLLQEAAIMGQFNHTNVVKLLGLVTIGSPVRHIYIVKNLRYFFYTVYHVVSLAHHLFGIHEER